MVEKVHEQFASKTVTRVRLNRMIRYLKDRGRNVSAENSDGLPKQYNELVREIWDAYIQVDFQLTRGDDLKKLGKMIGYTTADVSNKHNAKTVLMEDYLSFLRSNHPDQILEPDAIDHTVR